jgi:hypothetical protein
MATDDGGGSSVFGGGSGGGGARRGRGGARRGGRTPYAVGARPRPGYGGSGGSGGGSGGSAGGAGGPCAVEILHVPQATDLASLRLFFNEKLQQTVRWRNLRYEGSARAVMDLSSREDARKVIGLNNVLFQKSRVGEGEGRRCEGKGGGSFFLFFLFFFLPFGIDDQR